MSTSRVESYGAQGSTFVDRFGVWLSQLAIRRALPKHKNLHAIEFGCGYNATQLLALEDFLEKGVGIDVQINPNLKKLNKFEFDESTIEEFIPKIPTQSFDVVLLISVLEHLAQPQEMLAAIYSILKPGGVLLINVPTWRGKFFLEFSAFRLGLSPKKEIDDHKMYYDKKDIWPMLVQAGFKPSQLQLSYHKFCLNLFAIGRRV
jgi:SAM-dependent methyltransferase